MYIFTKTSVWPLYDSTRTDWVIKALVKQSLTRHTVLRSRHFTKRWTPKRYLERLTSHRIDDATSYAIDEYTWALITSFVIFRRNYLSLKIYGTPLKQFRRPGSGLATSCQSRCLPLSFISRVYILASPCGYDITSRLSSEKVSEAVLSWRFPAVSINSWNKSA